MTAKTRRRRPARRATGRHRRRIGRRAVWLRYPAARTIPTLALLAVLTATAIVATDTTAYAVEPVEPGAPVEPTVTSIDQVVDNIRRWLLGILAAWATFCLTVGMIRYTSGEPGEVEKGKTALRSAAIGYAGALLAPLLVTIIGNWLVV